ncbi:hypothetical protein AYL99_07250 [Fonsecaea erecta]|uniref:FAD dependent oxidoreductase domain-containing protein n=1 Tax=Fonsecaea erecta TaxID=1367422 RepID=A0A178ZEE4_9EURO|nr:hypothetical protein AYL99_07250 [Fonsecaea erecta]OAP58160.1 hypothetical protein AYL99_07250 [Fonsecaea erecta]
MSTSPEGIYDIGIVDPGIPVENPTQSYWLSEPGEISKLRSPWTDVADMVIIGSGITAVSLCSTLLLHQPDLRIVVVESRDLCSGATGRNGGHCKAMSPGVWFERKESLGIREAIRVMEFEHSHVDEIKATVEKYQVECDLNLLEGLDVYHDMPTLSRAICALEDMQKNTPSLAAKYTLYTDRAELSSRNLSEHVVGAIGMAAASLWPYKLVISLFERLIAKHKLLVQTNTTVTAVIDDDRETTLLCKLTEEPSERAMYCMPQTPG